MIKKYWLLLLVCVGSQLGAEEPVKAKKNKKPSRSCQRNRRDKCSSQGRLGVEFGYYAYPAPIRRASYPFYEPYWGTGYYYPIYPNYRSIGVDYGFAWGSPIW